MSDEEIHAAAVRAAQHIVDLTKGRLPPTTEKRWWAIANTPNILDIVFFNDYPHGNKGDVFREYINYTGRVLALSERGDWGTLEYTKNYKQMWESPDDHGGTPAGNYTALHVLPMGYSILEPITGSVNQVSLSDAVCFCAAEPAEHTDRLIDISEDYYLPYHGNKHHTKYHYHADYADVMSMLQSGFGEQRLLELLRNILVLTTQDVERVAQKNKAWTLGQEKTRRIEEQRAADESKRKRSEARSNGCMAELLRQLGWVVFVIVVIAIMIWVMHSIK